MMRILFVLIGTALIAGLSLKGWQLLIGPVPVVSWIAITPTRNFQLPFSLSRWSDVGLAPLWILLFYGIATRKFVQEEKILVSVGLVAGLILGVAYGILSNPKISGISQDIILGHELVIGLFIAGISSTCFGMKSGIIGAGIFGASYGFGKGIISGLGMGLLAGLSFEIGVLVVFLATALSKLLSPGKCKTSSF